MSLTKPGIKASETSFKLTEERYATGKTTATEYNEMRAIWLRPLSDGIQAKYDYPFRCKIPDSTKGFRLHYNSLIYIHLNILSFHQSCLLRSGDKLFYPSLCF